MSDEIIKKYLIYIVLVVLVVVGGGYYVVPAVTSFISTQEELTAKKEKVADLERQVEVALKAKQKKEDTSTVKEEKLIYESEYSSSSEMVNFSGMFETVLALAKQSGLKVKTIKFTDSPESDPIKRDHSATHKTTLLASEFVGTYTQLQNFLREIYRHQYLMGINSLEVIPYEFDKKILLINMTLNLYAKK